MSSNPAAAHLSETLFASAIATYALAMIGYSAEYAFGRRVSPQRPRTAAEPARGHVAAGATASSAQLLAAPLQVPRDTSSQPGSFGDRIGRVSFALTVLGVLVHTGSVAVRAIAVDAVPWSNMYEFASVAGLIGVIAFSAMLWKVPQIRHLGGFILLPVILLMFLAATVLYSSAAPLVPALQSYWLAIHVTLVSIAEGALMTSAVLTVLFVIKQRYERRTDQPGRTLSTAMTLAARLPAAAVLDKVAYRIVAFAFPIYTVAVICGAIWPKPHGAATGVGTRRRLGPSSSG